MALLKYWNGSAWTPLVGVGGAPNTKTLPTRPQPGSVLTQGTVALGDVNAPGGGVWDVPPWIDPGYWSVTVQVSVIAALYAGYGGADIGWHGEIITASGAQPAVQTNLHTHAGYWNACSLAATWQTANGGGNAFHLRAHLFAGGNFHTSGGVQWIVTAT